MMFTAMLESVMVEFNAEFNSAATRFGMNSYLSTSRTTAAAAVNVKCRRQVALRAIATKSSRHSD
jgi:hypothetical protein